MKYQQLKIDIKTTDGITKDMYNEIVRVVVAHGGEVLDDGQAPYTEDVTSYYGNLDGHRVDLKKWCWE